MEKTLIALASFAALSAAHADVTLYGVIDAGISSSSNGLSSDANNPANSNFYPSTKQTGTTGRQTGFQNGALTPSRWGIKGTEDLGSGLKANFVLESRINIANGTNPADHALLSNGSSASNWGAGDSSINGQMFDSQSTLGLTGDFGSIDAGYQLNLVGEAYGANDAFGAGYVSPLGTYGGLTGMGSSYTGRASNSFKYKTTMGTTRLGVFYALGGESGNAGAGTQMGLSIGAAITPTLDVTLVAQRMNDNVAFGHGETTATTGSGATLSTIAIPGLTATYFNSTSASLMGNWQVTPTTKLFAGYTSVVQSNPSNGTADAKITQVLGVPINSAAYTGTNTNLYNTNLTTTISWIGGKYDLDATSHIMASYYIRTVGFYTAALTSASDLNLYSQNHQNIYAVMYDKDLSKRTDVYVYGILNQYDSAGTAPPAAGSGTTATATSQWGTLSGLSISQFGAGMRVKF